MGHFLVLGLNSHNHRFRTFSYLLAYSAISCSTTFLCTNTYTPIISAAKSINTKSLVFIIVDYLSFTPNNLAGRLSFQVHADGAISVLPRRFWNLIALQDCAYFSIVCTEYLYLTSVQRYCNWGQQWNDVKRKWHYLIFSTQKKHCPRTNYVKIT